MATFSPATSNDDSIRNWTGIDLSGNTIIFGNGSGYYHSYLRFPNITIDKDATITSAKITFVAYNDRSEANCNVLISANASDDSVAPTTYMAFDALALSTANVEWNNIESWTQLSSFDTPDIASVIQEIISREGWVNGNALGILIKDNGSSSSLRQALSYDHGSSYPVLTILSSAPGTTTSEGDGTLPVPTITASLNGVVESLPLLTLVNCYVDVPHSDVDESLPIFTISATAIQSTVIAGDCTLPIFTISALTGYQTESDADVDFPVPTASASSLTGEISEGDCDVPFFTISATLLNGGISRGVATLPIFTFVGKTINTGTASESVPALTISAYAHGPLLHTLDESLPLLQIVATLVQQSTAFRCYVMNTENSAITEYDNFPFNSFCTFKGKHLAAELTVSPFWKGTRTTALISRHISMSAIMTSTFPISRK